LSFVLCHVRNVEPLTGRSKNEVQSTFLSTTNMALRVYNSNNGAVSWRIFTLEREARFLSPAPENQFANPSAGRVNRYQRLALRLQVFIEGLDNQQFSILEGIVFNRGHNCSDYACKLHKKQVWSAKSEVGVFQF
jgi:hypothetical protein